MVLYIGQGMSLVRGYYGSERFKGTAQREFTADNNHAFLPLIYTRSTVPLDINSQATMGG